MPFRLLEQHVRKGNLVAAQREFERLLVDLPGDDYVNLAWTHFWGAKTKNAQRDNHAAIRLMGLAMEYAQHEPMGELIGRIRLDSGAFHRQVGDFHMALELTQAFLIDLHLYPELASFEGAAHYNLGIIYRCRRDFDASELHYTQAEQILRTSGKPRWHVMALQNLAWILYERDKFQLGDQHLDQADVVIDLLDDRQVQLTQKYFRAFGAMRRGDLPGAAGYCEEILSPVSDASDEHCAWATWILAECAVQLGHFHEANALVYRALDLALHLLKDVRIIQYVSATRRKIYELTHTTNWPPTSS